MKTFLEYLNEAKEDDVDVNVYGEDNYKFATGRKPSGRGRWIFARKKNINFDVDKEGVDYIISKGGTPYKDAKKAAQKWAEEKGYFGIYLQS